MALLIIGSLTIVGWFAVGTIWNVRRGGELMRWMQPGLRMLAARTTVRWLGSTAVEMVMSEPQAPFAKIAAVIFLEPRDMPWMWALGRRKDLLIFRADLPRAPKIDAEWLDPDSWSGRDARKRAEGLPPPRADLIELARGCGLPVRRLAVHRDAPHLQLHVAAPKGGPADAGALFGAFRALGHSLRHAQGARPAAEAAAAGPAGPEAPPARSASPTTSGRP